MIDYLVGRGPLLLFVVLACLGVYLMMSERNLFKAVVGLYLFQTGVIVLFIAMGFREDGTIPFADDGRTMHNALPHAMMLTAIVVGIATIGVAIAILRRIQSEFGSIEEGGAGDEGA